MLILSSLCSSLNFVTKRNRNDKEGKKKEKKKRNILCNISRQIILLDTERSNVALHANEKSSSAPLALCCMN